MKAFRIEGEFLMGDRWQRFTREVASKTKDTAVEHLISDIGGRHGAKRKNIKVHNVREIKLEEIENAFVREEVEGDRVGK